MSKFMFRVSLEFKVTYTETIEDEVGGYTPYGGYEDEISPKLNAQIVQILKSEGLLASRVSEGFLKSSPRSSLLIRGRLEMGIKLRKRGRMLANMACA
jgi:hypothetical protein